MISGYQDILIQWSPEQSLSHMIQHRGLSGIGDLNSHIMRIQDEKMRYAVIRRIVRLLRHRNRSASGGQGVPGEVSTIIRTAIQDLGNP